MQQKKVLIAPLDWGLGHATRCIPVTTAFIELGYHVTIATEGAHEIISVSYTHLTLPTNREV